MKKNHPGIDTASRPSGDGCVECLAAGGWWLHLRRCAQCEHIGCCDSSPSQHATKHFASTGHTVVASFEPSEDWFFDYQKQRMIKGVSCCRLILTQRLSRHQAQREESHRIGKLSCTDHV